MNRYGMADIAILDHSGLSSSSETFLLLLALGAAGMVFDSSSMPKIFLPGRTGASRGVIIYQRLWLRKKMAFICVLQK